MTATAPPVFLYVFAHPPPGRPGHLRHLAGELEVLRRNAVLQRDRFGIEARFEPDAAPDHLIRLLTDPELAPRIVGLHFSGHAGPDEWLLAATTPGDGVTAHADGFVPLVRRLPSLKLVVINGCASAEHAAMLAEAVPAVVGTSAAIDDGEAARFAEWLHHRLGRGATVAEAFAAARDAVALHHGTRDTTRFARPAEAAPDKVPWLLLAGPDGRDWRLSDAVDDPFIGLPRLAATTLPTSPYRHLERFTAEHAGVFFGRAPDIRRIYDRCTAPDGPPVVLLYGTSGVGKSSLLEAGAMPRLKAAGYAIDVRRHTPTATLLETLSDLLGVDGDAVDWRAAEAQRGEPLIAVLDQIEEAIIAADGRADVLEPLLDAVARAFAGPLPPKGRLVLSFRKGYVAEVATALERSGLNASHVFIEPLDRQAVIEIVTGPTTTEALRAHYQLEIEPGLAERIADDLTAGSPAAVAPILQILLTGMWGERPTRPIRFDRDGYDVIRRRGTGLADVFARQLEIAAADDAGLMLDLLDFHCTARGTSAARTDAEVQAGYGHTPIDAARTRAIDARLLARWDGDASGGTRLAHDVWGPLVREALQRSDAPAQQARRILDSRRFGVDSPLSAAELDRIDRGRPAMRALTEDEVALVEGNRTRIEAEQSRAKLEKWQSRLTRVSLGAFALFAIGLLWMLDRGQDDLDAMTADKTAAVKEAGEKAQEARRQTELAAREAQARADAIWLRMATENEDDDPSLAAAALRNVSRAGRGPNWLSTAQAVLSEPIAYHWVPDGPTDDGEPWSLLGITPGGMMVRHRQDEVSRVGLYDGRLETTALPPAWLTTGRRWNVLLTMKRNGGVVGLSHELIGKRVRLTARQLDGVAIGEAIDCRALRSTPHAVVASDRWLFGGTCEADVWLMDHLGYTRWARPGPDVRRGRTVVLAVHPSRPDALICTTAPPEAGDGQWPYHLEWITDVGGPAERRFPSPPIGQSCELNGAPYLRRSLATISNAGELALMIGDRIRHLADPRRIAEPDVLASLGLMEQRFASTVEGTWGAEGAVFMATRIGMGPPVLRNGADLLRSSAAFRGSFGQPAPVAAGRRRPVQTTVLSTDPLARHVAHRVRDTVHVWPGHGRAPVDRGSIGADGMPVTKYWIGQEVLDVATDAGGKTLAALSRDGVLTLWDLDERTEAGRWIVHVDGDVRLFVTRQAVAVVTADRLQLARVGTPLARIERPIDTAYAGWWGADILMLTAVSGETTAWWVGGPTPVELATETVPAAVSDVQSAADDIERGDFWSAAAWTTADHVEVESRNGRWSVKIDRAGRITRTPSTVDAASAALAAASIGCVPPNARRSYFELDEDAAEDAWRACERARHRVPLPLP